MKNRRGFNPDARVKDADFAFRVLSDSVFTKGFLGRSLRENNGIPSVGVSSARRAGVIVDDNGKMRCPPGTPNANQFTDINMSNCMVPSAETVAQEAADVAKKMASRAPDGFKRGTHGKRKDRDKIPNAGVGFVNPNGFLEQRRIPKGVSVVSPIDGSQRQLSELDDSVKHLTDGGSLSDIPDEHLVRAILANSALDSDGKPEARFQIFGTGGGMHGMTRMTDTRTGASIGIKYNNGKAEADGEAISEVASELVLEHMGYEPTPMRIVPEVNESESGGESWTGIALVTELAHNRRAGNIESGRLADRGNGKQIQFGGEYNYNANPADVVRMSILDSVLNNPDRHEGNFMIAREGTGEGEIVPIDHSFGLRTPFEDGMSVQSITRPAWGMGLESVMDTYWDSSPNRENLIRDIADVQKSLSEINTEELKQQFEQLFAYLGTIGAAPNANQKEWVFASISRIAVLKDPVARNEIAWKLLPEYKRPKEKTPVATLDEWAKPPDMESVV